MHSTSMTVGKMNGARGCCPSCGRDVQRTHSFNGARLRESYTCWRCGPTEYTVTAMA